jgi:multidrug efflux system membrane fusion protein
VNQLEDNLSALGYGGFAVDDDFTAGTAGAVRVWQSDLGLPATGTVELGQVVFTPGPARIAAHTARVGTRTGEGGEAVLSYTGATRLVTVPLKVADQTLAVPGAKVSITIPGGKSVDGTIANVGTVATAPQQPSATPEPGGSAATAPQQASGTPGQSGAPTAAATVAVTVEIADQQALGTLDAAPVDVDFASQSREGVLAVPVAALLALPKGGYGVEIVEDRTTRIAAVKTGLFAAGRVEISGSGIEAGMKVGVPK